MLATTDQCEVDYNVGGINLTQSNILKSYHNSSVVKVSACYTMELVLFIINYFEPRKAYFPNGVHVYL